MLFRSDLVLDGFLAVLAVDDRQGAVQSGIVELARDTQAVIVPLAAACAKPWTLDGACGTCELPRPFSRVAILEGEPLRISPESDENELRAMAKQLETRLDGLRHEAQRLAETPSQAGSER